MTEELTRTQVAGARKVRRLVNWFERRMVVGGVPGTARSRGAAISVLVLYIISLSGLDDESQVKLLRDLLDDLESGEESEPGTNRSG